MVGSWVPGELLGVPGRFLGSLFFCLTPAALGVPTSRGYPKAVHPRFGQLHPAAGHPKPHSYVRNGDGRRALQCPLLALELC